VQNVRALPQIQQEDGQSEERFRAQLRCTRAAGEEPRRRQAGASQLITGRLLIYRIQALKLVGLCLVARVFVAREGHSGSGGPARGLAISPDKPDLAGNPARFSVVPARFLGEKKILGKK
jgi:hypothetical protein